MSASTGAERVPSRAERVPSRAERVPSRAERAPSRAERAHEKRERRLRTPQPEAVDALPGARGSFALLGEVLTTGVITVALALPLVTLPFAIAAGRRHLGRYLRGDDSSLARVLDDVRAGLPRSLPLGLATVVATLLLIANVSFLGQASIPAGGAVRAVSTALVVALPLVIVTCASSWSPSSGWRRALCAVPTRLAAHPGDTVWLAVACALLVVLVWQFTPLVVPGLGCLVFASVALDERRRLRAAR